MSCLLLEREKSCYGEVIMKTNECIHINVYFHVYTDKVQSRPPKRGRDRTVDKVIIMLLTPCSVYNSWVLKDLVYCPLPNERNLIVAVDGMNWGK